MELPMDISGRMPASLVATLSLAGTVLAQDEPRVPWDGQWRVEAAEARIEEHDGREALLLQNGTAWLDSARLEHGTIRFDLHVGDELGFYGVAFRAGDDANYEHVYVRPFLSGNVDATQYTPVYNGVSGWQLYSDERFNGAIPVPVGRWIRVELRIRDARAELVVDGERVVFPALQRPALEGPVGITASGAPAWFANVAVSRERPEPGDASRPDAEKSEAAGDGEILRTWVVSQAFAENLLDPAASLPASVTADLSWARANVDVRGIVNLAKIRSRSADANTVLAGVTLRTDSACLVRLRFGFSDRVVVYLDGRPLYRGNDGWRTRDYRFLGTVGLFDELILPLKRGDNVLRFAVSEDFGGWAITAQLPDSAGIEVLDR